jgi:hypothetical protein
MSRSACALAPERAPPLRVSEKANVGRTKGGVRQADASPVQILGARLLLERRFIIFRDINILLRIRYALSEADTVSPSPGERGPAVPKPNYYN